MQNVRRFFRFFMMALTLWAVAMSAYAGSSPTVMLQKTFDRFVGSLNANYTAIKRNPKIAAGIVKRIVLPKVDMVAMSRSVVGRTVWQHASRSQKRRFRSAFTNLVIRTYERAFVDYRYEKVKVYPVRGGYEGRRRLLIHSTVVRREAPPVKLSYRVVRRGSSWRIYDLSVEGISLLQSYRSQFAGPLAKGGIEHLIKVIKERRS